MMDLDRVVKAISQAYDVEGLKMLLRFDFDKDIDAILEPRPRLALVFNLVDLTIREGWIIKFFESVKKRSGNADLHKAVDDALTALRQPNVHTWTPIVLAPCPWCWWRENTDLTVLAKRLFENSKMLYQNDGIPKLSTALSYDLATYTDKDCCDKTVEEANQILEIALGQKARGKYISVTFTGQDIENDWARAIVEAEGKGTPTLAALFLAIYRLHASVIGVADVNLQRLHNVSRIKRG